MKSRFLICFAAMTLFAAVAAPIRLAAQSQQGRNQGHGGYQITNLGLLGGTSSNGWGINNEGGVAGEATLLGGQERAILWTKQTGMQDLGTLGGPNSWVDWPVKDDVGLLAGQSDTPNPDPLNENFCSTGNVICLGFLWQEGVMTALPTLGGNNGSATDVNNRGQVVGWAENSTHDPNCIPPQILDTEAFIWEKGQIQELPPLSGDSLGAATAVNDRGQVVGGSGICGHVSPAVSLHAVLWQNGSVTDLGNLGGQTNNYGGGINNRGEVIGVSDLTGDATGHAFLWTKHNGMQDLGTLPGDFSSAAFGINDKSQVVGQSCDQNGNCRAFLWENGAMTDLNTLVCHGSSLYLTEASDINDGGAIAGSAYDQNTGDVPAFLAVPSQGKGHCKDGSSEGQKMILPENVREQLRQRHGFGRFRVGMVRPQ